MCACVRLCVRACVTLNVVLNMLLNGDHEAKMKPRNIEVDLATQRINMASAKEVNIDRKRWTVVNMNGKNSFCGETHEAP